MSKLNFNTAEHEELGDFTPLPAGEYIALIDKSEIKATKDGQGAYLSLQWKLVNNLKENGRIVFDNLNLQNKNQQAVEIANKRLKSICVACGISGVVTDSEQLHGIPVILRLKVNKATDAFPASNSVVTYKKIGGTVAPPSSGTLGEGQPAASGGGVRPWD